MREIMKGISDEYGELVTLAIAFIFFLGVYIEFRTLERRDIAIAQNAFLTLALVAIISFWDRAGAWRWLIAIVFGLICTLVTVALYGRSSKPDHSRPERKPGGGHSSGNIQGPS
ncbi:MAG: hypothetical protein IPH30_14370 [Betaproteobacteria bacterium]|nr:hypothetical protein [Betaproteobacteria bacterium]